MNSFLIASYESCTEAVRNVIPLLYYSHLPTALAAFLIGLFVFIKDRKSLVNQLLFAITVLFSIWSLCDLFVWLYFYKTDLIMFVWSFFGLLYLSIYVLSLYFVYVYFDEKNVSLTKKIIFVAFLLPTILLAPTQLNLAGYDGINCQSFENPYFTNYYYFASLLIFIWILLVALVRIKRAEQIKRKQMILLTIGIELFLFSFFCTGFLVSYLIEKGIFANYDFEQYGLFGMPIFISFLAYIIVRYKAFNIKLLSAQALVFALVILIGSQFFFIQTNTNRILTGITLAISVGFGYMLIKSVKTEVERKEELQTMADRLAQANDKLRTLDNAKSEFISIASHQLRTPLTAIKGFISLILEGSYGVISPEIKTVVNNVYISNERLISLVEDMLNLSRIESGRMEYVFEKIKLEAVCKEVYDTLVIRAKEKGLKLELKIPANPLPEITTDRNKIREVISNLTDNAIKYTKKGWVSIRLSQKEDSVIVAIADTGIGVPEDEMPYLFEKFSRGKNISRLNTGGTGLGLHVGKRMMEALGGKIWVESAGADLGSTFFVEVPVEREKGE